ncbi:MAG: pyridoxal 5'-phosphate synthase glutaminase subunit PdxT [Thermoflexus sp.]|nr:pyridoxal 5'-phosphate synthase glutaminase subunit PdxT [Thermoflexus sp.]
MKIGVLGLQGDYLEHHQVLRRLGVETVDVRLPQHLEGVDGLIIPGGESTTIGALAERYGLMDPLRRMAEAGKPIWGTCAGMIFLAKDVGRPQPTLGLMDIQVQRNAFGRQIDSFEVDLEVPALARLGDPRPFHAVFIRAPLIEAVGPGAEVLARLENGSIVAAQQGHLLATAFHPELTEDVRFHQYFLEWVHQAARG